MIWRVRFLKRFEILILLNSKGTPLLQIGAIWIVYLIPVLSYLKFETSFYGIFPDLKFLQFFGYPGLIPNISHPISSGIHPTIFFPKLQWCPFFSSVVENSPSKGGTYLNFCMAYRGIDLTYLFKGGSSRNIKSDSLRRSQNHQNLRFDPYGKYQILHFFWAFYLFPS